MLFLVIDHQNHIYIYGFDTHTNGSDSMTSTADAGGNNWACATETLVVALELCMAAFFPYEWYKMSFYTLL